MGIYNSALMDFGQASKGDPNESEYYFFQGKSQEKMNQFKEALTMYDLALSKNKHVGDYYYNRGYVKQKLRNYTDAIKDYNKAIDNDVYQGRSNDENKYNSKFNKGICLRSIGELEKSITVLKETVDMKNEQPMPHFNLGLSYFEQERFEEAMTSFSKAIGHSQIEKKEHDPETRVNTAKYYCHRALAQEKLELLGDAFSDLEMAIKLDPDYPQYYFHRGNVLFLQRKYEVAHEDYDRALELEPGNSRYYHQKGLAYEQTDHIELAIKMYQEALGQKDAVFASRFHLGGMHHKSNQFHDALQCYTAVLENYSDDKNIFIKRG